MARAPRPQPPARPRWPSGPLRTLARCPRLPGLVPASWRSPSGLRAHRPRQERQGGRPTNGCGAAWRLQAAVAAVRPEPRTSTVWSTQTTNA
ncbi:caudal type homeobox 1 [Mus musculus]|nr:caudal type homeobox 1 [Mus musculus]